MDEAKKQEVVEIIPHEVHVHVDSAKAPTPEEIKKAYDILGGYIEDPIFCFLPVTYDKFPENMKKTFECVDKEMDRYIANKLVLDSTDLKQQVLSNFHKHKK